MIDPAWPKLVIVTDRQPHHAKERDPCAQPFAFPLAKETAVVDSIDMTKPRDVQETATTTPLLDNVLRIAANATAAGTLCTKGSTQFIVGVSQVLGPR